MKNAKFNLEKLDDRDAFRLHCTEQIAESERTWSDVSALHAQSYAEYFDACLDGDGALYNNPNFEDNDLLVSGDQFDIASQNFAEVMRRCKDDWFQDL